ncbi:spermidine synthase [Aestuariimicrobium ganziense]|uniref:spermidine synthase n=1 Tax=Aestuariimicrobium ganziense TaxID=2773677 RepID=UPI001943B06C|nr:fused MFS/spermidine synthase [Aestuariimicrobium ganziense]
MSEPRVVPDPDHPGAWFVRVGGADQSWVDPDDPEHLAFDYMQRIAHHIDAHAPRGERLRVVHIGGAGLSLARYVAHTRPTSPQIVCEPDETLTAEVRETIGLPRNSGIKVRGVDGRAGVRAMPDDYADIVIVDAFVGARVPADLVTVEFFADLRRIARPDAQVLLNVTDMHPFAWTRRLVSGLRIYFRHVALSTESSTLKGRRFGNVVIGASATGLPIQHLNRAAAGAPFPYRVVSGEHLTSLVGGAQPFHDGASDSSPAPPSGLTAFR